jgi:hypothetical protein
MTRWHRVPEADFSASPAPEGPREPMVVTPVAPSAPRRSQAGLVDPGVCTETPRDGVRGIH